MRDAPSAVGSETTDIHAEPFRGQVGIFTDAAGGVGRQIATDFARLGGRLIVADPNETELHRLGEDLRRDGRQASLLSGNVADPDFVARLYDNAIEAFGRVDHVLVNPTREDSLAALCARGFHQRAWFEVNSVIAAESSRLCRLDAERNGHWTRSVTFLLSILPLGDDLVGYQRQRRELGKMVLELAAEWAHMHVRVNAVVPSTAQCVVEGPQPYSGLLDAVGASWAALSLMLDPVGPTNGRLIETVAVGPELIDL